MKKNNSLAPGVISGLLLMLAWPDFLFAGLIFIAWVPLFYLAKNEQNRKRYFIACFFAMLTWNAGTTWWIWNSTAAGAIAAIIANSLLMCIPLLGFHSMYRKYGMIAGLLGFIVFWLAFEFVHLNWQLSWPWLTLGNVFAENTGWVQWYEYTGAGGGSFWILLINVLIFLLLLENERKHKFQLSFFIVILIVVPLLISGLLEKSYAEKKPVIPYNVIIVQPNIDPYNEKFDEASAGSQVQKLINLTENVIDSNTRLILWPETALSVGVWQDQVEQTPVYRPVFDLAEKYPFITIQTGIETFKGYGTVKETKSARKIVSTGVYYDAFNASTVIKTNEPLQFYNKSKLVPGVETLPDFLLWMANIFEKFGGTTGGYGHDKEAAAFNVKGNPYITAPIICYESIYGEYITGYVNKGANLLTIMTNDGWWANTAGHRQHLQYARLRAIETRKWIARSANTGISAVINHKGDIVQSQPWDTAEVIKYSIPVVSGETFYVKHGDFIFRIAFWISIIYAAVAILFWIKDRFKK